MRAAYGRAGKTLEELDALFAHLQANGFNAYFAKCDFDVATKEKWDEFAARVDLAQKHNLKFFVCCNFLGPWEAKVLAGLKSRYTMPDGLSTGSRPKTACPLDEEFWQKVVCDRALQAARMSRDHPALAGFIVDPEMYSAEATTYGPPCLCDACFKKYLLSALCTAVAPDVPFAERVPYLKKREGAEKEYAVLAGAQAGSIAKGIRKQVREAAPALILGWLLFPTDSHWFNDAVVEQWADDDVPVLLAPEKTYYVGYSKALVDDPVEKLKAAMINAIFLPGIGWDRKHPGIGPEKLPANLYLCATKTDGYWVWHVPYTAPADNVDEKYWSAFKLGNEEITKWAASGGTYQTGLKIEGAPPPKAGR